MEMYFTMEEFARSRSTQHRHGSPRPTQQPPPHAACRVCHRPAPMRVVHARSVLLAIAAVAVLARCAPCDAASQLAPAARGSEHGVGDGFGDSAERAGRGAIRGGASHLPIGTSYVATGTAKLRVASETGERVRPPRSLSTSWRSDAAPGTTHDGFTSTGRCYDLAAAKVELSFLHVTTSLFPLAQTCVLLVSAAVLFARLTSAYRAAYHKTHGTLHQRLLGTRTPTSVVTHIHGSPASLAPASGGAPGSGAAAASGNSAVSRASAASGRSAWRGGWAARWWRRWWSKRRRDGDDTKRMVLPIYYSYAQLLCLLYFLQIIVYLPGDTLFVAMLRYTSFAVAAGFDNFIVVNLFTRRPKVAVCAAASVTVAYGAFAAIVIPLAPCHWCHYYVSQIPATRLIEFPYLFAGIVYAVLAVWSRARWRSRWLPTPRPALAWWGSMLSLAYLLGGIGMMILNTTPSDVGFCFVDIGVMWYTLAYVPFLYSTMTSDTAYCNRQQFMTVLAGMRQRGARDSASGSARTGLRVDPTVDQLQRLLSDPSVNVIPYEDVQLVRVLGMGAAGRVYAGTWRGAPVAVKQLGGPLSDWARSGTGAGNKSPSAAASDDPEATTAFTLALVRKLVREAAILSSLRHPNIVTLFGIVVDAHHHALVTELVAGPTLYNVLHPSYRSRAPGSPSDAAASPSRTPLSPSQGVRAVTWHSKLRMLLQCATGMAFLHGCSPRVLHRDLKSPNVLVRRGDGVVKVCDFGLSVHRDTAAGRPPQATNGGTFTTSAGKGGATARGTADRERMTSVQQHAVAIGTCQWSAPEVLREEPHSAAADVWSFGVITWEAASPSPPFAGMSAMRVAAMVAYCDARLPMPPVLGDASGEGAEASSTAPATALPADAVTVGGGDELLPTPRGLVELMRECLAEKPSDRPSFGGIVDRLRVLVDKTAP